MTGDFVLFRVPLRSSSLYTTLAVNCRVMRGGKMLQHVPFSPKDEAGGTVSPGGDYRGQST